MSIKWVPDPAHGISTEPKAILSYMSRQFRNLAATLEAFQVNWVQMTVVHNEPDKPRAGMMVEVDGTNWDPGSGAGLYIYRGGAWTRIG